MLLFFVFFLQNWIRWRNRKRKAAQEESSVPLPKRKPLTKWQCFLIAQSEGNELVYIVTSFVLVNCVSHHVNKDFTLVKKY